MATMLSTVKLYGPHPRFIDGDAAEEEVAAYNHASKIVNAYLANLHHSCESTWSKAAEDYVRSYKIGGAKAFYLYSVVLHNYGAYLFTDVFNDRAMTVKGAVVQKGGYTAQQLKVLLPFQIGNPGLQNIEFFTGPKSRFENVLGENLLEPYYVPQVQSESRVIPDGFTEEDIQYAFYPRQYELSASYPKPNDPIIILNGGIFKEGVNVEMVGYDMGISLEKFTDSLKGFSDTVPFRSPVHNMKKSTGGDTGEWRVLRNSVSEYVLDCSQAENFLAWRMLRVCVTTRKKWRHVTLLLLLRLLQPHLLRRKWPSLKVVKNKTSVSQ